MKMPVYDPQVEVRPTPLPRANTQAFTAPYAAAAESDARMGEEAARLGRSLNLRNEFLEHQEAMMDAFKRTASARLDMTNALLDAQSKAQPGAPGFTKQFLEDTFDTYAKQTLANAPDKTQPYLQERLAGLRDHMGELALNFEANANLAKRQQDLNDTVSTHANVVRTDPSQFDASLQDALTAVHNSGLPPDRMQQAEDHVKGMLASSMAEGLIDRDPHQAQKMLADPRFDTYFNPQVKNQLIERADALAQRQDKEALASYQADVKTRYSNEVAAIRDRGYGVGGLTSGMIRKAFPDQADSLIGNLNAERQFYNDRQSIALNTPAQDAALLAKYKPEGDDYALQAGRRDALQSAIAQKWNSVTRDPVGYVTSASPQLKAAFDAAQADPSKLPAALALSDQLQTQIGLRPDQHFVLSGDQAQGLVGQITSAPPEQAAASIQGLAKTYGDKWPQVFSELVGQKLPTGYQVLATVNAPGAAQHLVEAIKTGKKQMQETLGADAKGIDDGLTDAMRPFVSTLSPAPNGAKLGAAWQSAAQLLAYRYATMGEAPSSALNHAVNDLVTSKYDIVQGGGTNARAPKGMGGLTQTYADKMLAGLDADQIETPPQGPHDLPLTDTQRAAAYFRDGVKNGSMWVTSPRDDGWMLLDSNRQPVTLKSGSPVMFKFSDAAAAAAAAPPTVDPSAADTNTGGMALQP